jgi:hypothetical protein
MSEAHSPHLSSHLGVPARTSNQLTEVTVGFTDPLHSRRISKLSWKYLCDKHQQRAARKRPPSAVRESPPPPAKARANIALMHGASAASVAAASVTMDAANAAGIAGAAHAISAASLAKGSNSSDSDDSD